MMRANFCKNKNSVWLIPRPKLKMNSKIINKTYKYINNQLKFKSYNSKLKSNNYKKYH
jgi:hypothetical protein